MPTDSFSTERIRFRTSENTGAEILRIGVSCDTCRGARRVVIKGLFIKATSMSRVNMTSVITVSPSCAPAPK